MHRLVAGTPCIIIIVVDAGTQPHAVIQRRVDIHHLRICQVADVCSQLARGDCHRLLTQRRAGAAGAGDEHMRGKLHLRGRRGKYDLHDAAVPVQVVSGYDDSGTM